MKRRFLKNTTFMGSKETDSIVQCASGSFLNTRWLLPLCYHSQLPILQKWPYCFLVRSLVQGSLTVNKGETSTQSRFGINSWRAINPYLKHLGVSDNPSSNMQGPSSVPSLSTRLLQSSLYSFQLLLRVGCASWQIYPC